ncbi:hypothetical protein BH11BAC7_BH11BAC7_02010 [soil metagenome]
MHFPRLLIPLFILLSGIVDAQQMRYCIPERFSQNEVFTDLEIAKDTDIVYGYSFNPFTNSYKVLTMNIYYPLAALDTMQQRPFILLAHGGSFINGNINTQEYLCAEYAKRGFVSASINYREGWNCLNPFTVCDYCVNDTSSLRVATYMAVQDVRAALRFMAGNATGWKVNPDWFFVGGASAGSIATFQAAIWTQAQANLFSPIAAGMVGLLDTAGNAFPVNYSIRGISDNCGAIVDDSNLVSQLTIPLISFSDEYDCVMPSDQGHLFGCNCSSFYKVYGAGFIHERMQAAGGCTELNTLLGSTGHCYFPPQTIVERTACFFKRVMCEVCESDTNTNPNYTRPCNTLATGIEFGLDDFSFSISPVPVDELLTISFSEHARHGGVLRCINALGQPVFSQAYPYMTQKLEISTSGFSSGVYFLIFENNQSSSSLKMMIIHP